MHKNPLLRTLLLPAALLSSLALAVPVLAQSTDGSAGAAGMHHHWAAHHPRSPFAQAIHQLNLSTEQKSQIHSLMQSAHGTMRAQFQSLREQHNAFDRTVPGTADFQAAESALEQAEAAATQAHVQHEADMHTKIYALLTDAQKTQLATLLAQSPQQPSQDQSASPEGSHN